MQKINIYITQGDDFEYSFTPLGANSSPMDLTGYVLSAKMKQFYSGNINSSWAFTTTYTSNTNQLSLGLSANTTAQIPYGRYVYSVKVKSQSNNIETLYSGLAVVNPVADTDLI